MGRHLLLLFCITALSCNSNADQIVLQNGDRLTGTIIKSDKKELVINTTYAGQVTVQWGAVQNLSSTAPLHLQLEDGRMLAGSVVAEDGEVSLVPIRRIDMLGDLLMTAVGHLPFQTVPQRRVVAEETDAITHREHGLSGSA